VWGQYFLDFRNTAPAASIGHKAVMAYFMKAVWKNVAQKATDKFFGLKHHLPPAGFIG
jgi:hypothetical protein